MLRVLLVDDEPFIVQGLAVLIDWEKEGYVIVGTAANGQAALEFLEEEKVDLIIADIKMPVMSGLELLENIRKRKISEAYFVILSGYADFSYAQRAIKYKCTEYILKPVEKESLLRILRNVAGMCKTQKQKNQNNKKMERAYLERNVMALLYGKFDNINLEYVKKHMHLSKGVRYIGIELERLGVQEEIPDEEKRQLQRTLYGACLEFLKEEGSYCIFDVSGQEKSYDIGFIYCDYMGESRGISLNEYIEKFLSNVKDAVQMPVVILVGKEVNDISNVSKSYGTVCVLRSLEAFHQKKEIYYYEEEVQVNFSNIVLCKKSLDALLGAIEQNSKTEIIQSVDLLYEEMKQMGVNTEVVNLNINYLMFQLIHLATQQDSGINQEEILRFISESSFEEGIRRGSKRHLTRFSCEYAAYLAQLRKNVSRGVLAEVEKEVQENYAENLTLKELSKKYYVNSAYLGQLFRKQYGQSFKDYLNIYRIEQAVLLLLHTDKKIYEVAEAVGYHDLDYFVNRFISAKGCTPAKFRKKDRE